jgi:soluble lytic murein transglycosylase-like protein
MRPVLKQVPTPTPETATLPRPYRLWPLISSVAVNTVLLAAVALLGFGILREGKMLRMEREFMRDALNKQNGDIEQLRVDISTTMNENVVYLKILVLKPSIDRPLAREIAKSLAIRAREHRRDPDLVLAMMDVESNFNPNAISPVGAVGLMQIMPVWKKDFGIDKDLHDVDTSINYGLTILSTYEKVYGNIDMALTAYNRGPSVVNADMRHGKSPWNGYSQSVLKSYSRIKYGMRA